MFCSVQELDIGASSAKEYGVCDRPSGYCQHREGIAGHQAARDNIEHGAARVQGAKYARRSGVDET